MTGQILLDVLKHMDALNLFTDDRQNNNKRRVPFLLVDGHDSRFNTSFLHYINNESTQWMVCIGVPYGTSYWQVGDSNEQNGSYKMGLTQEKQEMIRKRITHMNQDMQVRPTDIVTLVNKVWKVSFERQLQNRNAISERGWLPYNRKLLQHPDIRASMTSEELKEENVSEGIFSIKMMMNTTYLHHKQQYLHLLFLLSVNPRSKNQNFNHQKFSSTTNLHLLLYFWQIWSEKATLLLQEQGCSKIKSRVQQ
jgi:hypothetical protein